MAAAAYRCLTCALDLVRSQLDSGSSWVCTGCGGFAVTMAVIRKHATPNVANMLWTRAYHSPCRSDRGCPSCFQASKRFEVEDDRGLVELDACIPCQVIWFDPAEIERLKIRLSPSPDSESRRERAKIEVDLQAAQASLSAPTLSIRDLVLRYLADL